MRYNQQKNKPKIEPRSAQDAAMKRLLKEKKRLMSTLTREGDFSYFETPL